MRKSKICLKMAICLMILCLGVLSPALTSQAALKNVTKAPKASAGQWVIAKKGYRYKYSSTQKYAKNKWLKIGGNIYYFKADGYLKTGWLTYRQKKYYLGEQGALVTSWRKIGKSKYYFWKADGTMAIGKVKIAGKYYYFNSKGAMKTGWQKIGGKYYYFYPGNGSMAVSTTIGKYQVDKKGRRVTESAGGEIPEKTGKVDYFLGDSRTVGLGAANGISGKCKAKVGEGYAWCKSTAIPWVKRKLKSKPTATVVINFGVNDIDNHANYISCYRDLIKAYPKAKIYIMSVNPVDSKYNWGYYTYAQMKKKITTFNKKIKEAFPNNYLDCYSYLQTNKFATSDGIHYTNATYQKIYEFVLNNV